MRKIEPKTAIDFERVTRYPFFDTYRGVALILMTIYHFCFDLNVFGVISQNMNFDSFWLNFRTLIMSSFLLLVEISFQFAKPRYNEFVFKKRTLQIAICAGFISLISFILNSQTWIYFGVLHFIFFASLIAPILIRIPNLCLPLGIGIILLPQFFQDFLFARSGFNLTGLSPIKPNTEDFSPIAPWLGVVMVGIFLGGLIQSIKPYWAQRWEIPALSILGRHSLFYYMTHQIILYPVAWLISRLTVE